MAKIVLDGKDFEYDDLSDEGKKQVDSLQFVNSELRKLEAQAAVLKTAQNAYSIALKNIVEKD